MCFTVDTNEAKKKLLEMNKTKKLRAKSKIISKSEDILIIRLFFGMNTTKSVIKS